MANRLLEALKRGGRQSFQNSPFMTMAPSPTRSALVEQLLQKSMQPAQSTSAIESLNIASKPILAAILGKREDRARDKEDKKTAGRREALVRALQRANDPNASPEQKQAAQMAVSTISAGLPADDPISQTIQGNRINQAFAGSEAPKLDTKEFKEGEDYVTRVVINGLPGPEVSRSPIAGRTNDLIELVSPEGERKTFREDDRRIDDLIEQNWTRAPSRSEQRTGELPTEGERRVGYASGNLLNMERQATQVLENNPNFNPAAIAEARGNVPMVGNVLASPEFRQYRSAADEWTTNLVFLRSGATAREEEKDSAFRNYWAQPGDDASTLAFKEGLRLSQMRDAYAFGDRANRIGSDEANQVIGQLDERIEANRQIQELVRDLTRDGVPQAQIMQALRGQ